jgi:hypothetical protein
MWNNACVSKKNQQIWLLLENNIHIGTNKAFY